MDLRKFCQKFKKLKGKSFFKGRAHSLPQGSAEHPDGFLDNLPTISSIQNILRWIETIKITFLVTLYRKSTFWVTSVVFGRIYTVITMDIICVVVSTLFETNHDHPVRWRLLNLLFTSRFYPHTGTGFEHSMFLFVFAVTWWAPQKSAYDQRISHRIFPRIDFSPSSRWRYATHIRKSTSANPQKIIKSKNLYSLLFRMSGNTFKVLLSTENEFYELMT